ncbi:DNA topoisomerase 2-binding protein 1, partial [Actinomortierella wolfii]
MFRQSNPKRSQTSAGGGAGAAATNPSATSSTPGQSTLPIETVTAKPLAKCLISYTGLSAAERSQVNKLVLALGGETNVDMTDDVNYLIAKKTMTPKYKIAFSLMIPVIDPEWLTEIHQLWSNGQVVDLRAITAKHSLGPFRGCSICVTGFANDVRNEIETYTIQYGGVFTPDMTRVGTTHLVCDVAKGKKYIMAQRWGIKCVSYKWFVECMRTLELVDESQYPAPTEEERLAEEKNADPLSDPIMDARASSIPDFTYLEKCHIYLCPTFDDELIAKCKTMIRMGGGVQVATYDPQEVTHVLVPGMTLNERTMELFNDATELPSIVSFPWLKACSRAHKLVPESQYVVPFPTRSETALRKNQHLQGIQTWTTDPIVATSSRQARPRLEDTRASRIATIRSRGSATATAESGGAERRMSPTSATSSSFQQHREQPPPLSPPTSPGHPSSSPSGGGNAISPRSIRKLLMNRSMSGLLAQDVQDLSIHHNHDSNGGTPVGGKPASSSLSSSLSSSSSSLPRSSKFMTLSEPSLSSLREQGQEEDNDDQSADDDMESNPIPNRALFSGLSFTTFGCKEETVNTVRTGTVQYGGKYYEAGTVPEEEQNTVYTVVPRSMRRAETEHLKGSVVTTSWIEKCVHDGRLAPKRGFLFRPLENVPVEGFQDLKISLSSTVDEFEAFLLAKIVKILGATYHENVIKSSTNLLISNAAQGPKFEFMWKNKRPVVTCEWLKQSVAAGHALPYEPYLVMPDKQSPLASVYRTPSGDTLSSQKYPSSFARQQRDDSPIFGEGDFKSEQTDTPLAGLVLCVTSKALSEQPDLITIIQDLGGQVVRQYNQSITHVVHKAAKAKDTFRDCRQAKKDNKHVVAPQWVLQCRDERKRVDERLFPETYDPKRRVLETTLPPPTRSKTLPATQPTRPTFQTSNSASANLGSLSYHHNNNNNHSYGNNHSNGINGNKSRLLTVESSQVLSQMMDSPGLYHSTMSLDPPMYESMTQDVSMQHAPPSSLTQQQQPSLSLSVDTSNSSKIRRGRKRERMPSDGAGLNSQAPTLPPSEPTSATTPTAPYGTLRDTTPVDEGIDYSDDEGSALRRKLLRRMDASGWATRDEQQKEMEEVSVRGHGRRSTNDAMQEDRSAAMSSMHNQASSAARATTGSEHQGPRRPYQFLLTGIRFDERDEYKKKIRELGGTVLEDETQDQEVWRRECTHLLTNA